MVTTYKGSSREPSDNSGVRMNFVEDSYLLKLKCSKYENELGASQAHELKMIPETWRKNVGLTACMEHGFWVSLVAHHLLHRIFSLHGPIHIADTAHKY